MKKRLRALLLAAGLGTRLRPLTDKIPKWMVDIGGEPIIESWLRKLEAIDCEAIIINTHYHAKQINAYIEKREKTKVEIVTSYEGKLLGTGGTLLKHQNFFKGYTGIVIHADNATEEVLSDLIDTHYNKPKECVMTMLTFESEEPSKCGIIKQDENNIVQEFYEKEKNPPGRIANGAAYVFDYDMFDQLRVNGNDIIDISYDVIPMLLGKIKTWHTNKKYIDIGTTENLKKAQHMWHKSIEK